MGGPFIQGKHLKMAWLSASLLCTCPGPCSLTSYPVQPPPSPLIRTSKYCHFHIPPNAANLLSPFSDFLLYFFFFLDLFRVVGRQSNLWKVGIWKFPGWGQIGAAVADLRHSHRHMGSELHVTYTTAHSNARSSIHWVRPGIEPATSWILVGFISVAPQWEFSYCTFYHLYCMHLRSCFLVIGSSGSLPVSLILVFIYSFLHKHLWNTCATSISGTLVSGTRLTIKGLSKMNDWPARHRPLEGEGWSLPSCLPSAHGLKKLMWAHNGKATWQDYIGNSHRNIMLCLTLPGLWGRLCSGWGWKYEKGGHSRPKTDMGKGNEARICKVCLW